MTRARRAWLTAIVLVLTGCGGADMGELEGYVKKVKSRPPKALEPLPDIPQVDPFVYNPGTRRDPFAMDEQSAQAMITRVDTGLAPDPHRRKEELEQFSLDSIRMVGTLEREEDLWALVTTPGGILHRVRVGNYLGTNNGQIIRIGPDEIELTEIVNDGAGNWREREASIALTQ
jgi:type IV pilus assembly protein PilP